MAKLSAGLIMYRFVEGRLQVLLVHPGGPYWRNKDIGAWSIPKGEYLEPEDPFAAAIREFTEETGQIPVGDFIVLTPVRQAGGKEVSAWAFEGEFDTSNLNSNTFDAEWPPHSGQIKRFPEIDRAAWFDIDEAKHRLLNGQVPLVEELETICAK